MPFGWIAGATLVSGYLSSEAQGDATEAAARAAGDEAALSRESLDFYKQRYADQKPMLDQAAALANQTSAQQLEIGKQNADISKDYWDYQKGTFRPLEQGIVTDAQNYDTTERREAAASGAVADVGLQAEAARQAQTRQQARMGVNPSSGKAVALQSQMGLSEALGKAGAANTARDKIELQGYARKMDAANLGRGLASSQATSAGVALNAGNSAVANAGLPLSQANQSTALMGQGYSTAMNGLGNAGNLFVNVAQQAGSGYDEATASLGQMAGMYAYGKMK